ncbi:ribosomal RNA small subunit methyltransferase A [Candidatus Babeliales bacterium]|nr:ribosomal RNA small subunit methyltransferase A [Candidatus Babeliales bacterium]MBP9843305.1 ribosomal RNA small subunit methyltransferase A [Candidatus Babeliales bacterium]
MSYKRPEKQGITLKKHFGQHFLCDSFFVDQVIAKIKFTPQTHVFEIGCGEGMLTKAIAAQELAKLQVFEIDPEWAGLVKKNLKDDPRVTVSLSNILDQNLNEMFAGQKWTLLANLPYNITFPILHLLQKSSGVVAEGVIMIQEEVAQKILQKSGRGYGYPSLFFQHYFSWQLMDKVPPTAFFPPPKVFSRLLYFKPIETPEYIEDEPGFWKFIRACFMQPRRTLKNNLQQSKYGIEPFTPELLQKRAQELSMQDFLHIWRTLQVK